MQLVRALVDYELPIEQIEEENIMLIENERLKLKLDEEIRRREQAEAKLESLKMKDVTNTKTV